jgi:hypothetical protein
LRKKKELLRKKPARNSQKKYWTGSDFERLKAAPPARLYSKGPLPWRLLAYLLKVSPDVDRIRTVVRKRLLDQPRIDAGMKHLHRMLLALHRHGYVILGPEPPPEQPLAASREAASSTAVKPAETADYNPILATTTPALDKLLVFRAVHPLYGAFLIDQLATADRDERIQAFESVLELPRPLLKYVRVPFELPPGPLATGKLDPELIARGLMVAKPPPAEGEEEEEEEFVPWDERPPVFAEKLKLLFDATHPDVTDVETQAVWAAGEVLRFGGNFNTYITHKNLTKQEGLIFRHLLRLILLLEEFEQLTPPGVDPRDWQAELKEIEAKLTEACRTVDPASTEETIKKAHAADVVEGEEHAQPVSADSVAPNEPESEEERPFAEEVFEE